MKITIEKALQLKRPPTSLCTFKGRMYVSTKGKRVFYTENFTDVKSILFSSQVNSLASNNNLIFCCQKDGKIFGLDKSHKSVYKSSVGKASCFKLLHDNISEDILVGSSNSKVTSFGSNAMLKNTFFFSDTPLADFAISQSRLLAGCSENDQNVVLINIENKQKSTLKIIDGFPEFLHFLSNDTLLVSSTSGVLSLFNLVNKKRISFFKLPSSPSCVKVISDKTFMVGIENKLLLVDFSSFNKMEIVGELEVKGLPVDIIASNGIYVAISRESRLGRFKRLTDGKNHILEIKIE